MQFVFCFNRNDVIHETMAEYMSAMKAIKPNSTILPLCFDSWGTTPEGKLVSGRFQPFLHAAGQVAAERRALNLLNYEAYYAYFLLRFRPGLDPYSDITSIEKDFGRPVAVEFLTYKQRTGRQVDDALVGSARNLGNPIVRRLFDQLEAGFERVLVSHETAWMQLYGRKDLQARAELKP